MSTLAQRTLSRIGLQRTPRRRRALTAAAQRVPLGLADAPKFNNIWASRDWQDRAWTYFDGFGIVKQPQRYVANQVRRISFFGAATVGTEEAPVPIQDAVGEIPGITQGIADLTTELVDMVASPEGGQAEIKGRMCLNLSIPGECYLLAEQVEGQTRPRFEVLSVDELQYRGPGELYVVSGPMDRNGRKIIEETSVLIRVWDRHPRYSRMPDSGLRGVMDDLEELRTLNLAYKGTHMSRIWQAGMMWVDQDLSFGPVDPTTGNDATSSSSFMQALGQRMMQAVSEPGSAAGQVPLVVEGSGPYEKQIAQIPFERPMTESDQHRYGELILNIARGIDVPPEVYLGLGETTTYANARLITQEGYLAHVDPKVLMILNALTDEWVQPGLRAAGVSAEVVEQIIAWRDPSDIIVVPDLAKNAIDLLKLGEISGDAARRATGFGEADAPDDAERARFEARSIKTQDQANQSADNPNAGDETQAIAAAAVIDTTAVERATVTATDPAGPTDREAVADAPSVRPLPDHHELGAGEAPTREGGDGATDGSTVGQAGSSSPPSMPLVAAADAAGQAKLDRMTDALAAIDSTLRAKLTVAADRSRDRSLRAIGAKLRSRTQGHRDLKTALATVSNEAVAATLGPDGWETLAFDPVAELDESSFDDLHGHYENWVAAAQARALTQLRKAGAKFTDREHADVTERQTADRKAGWTVLVASMLATARDRIHDPNPAAPEMGEFDSTVMIQGQMISDTLARAGGGSLGANVGREGLVATGQLIGEQIRENVGAVQTGYVWQTGDPDRPFDPHQELSGVDFKAWDDPVLENPGDWPTNEYLFPSDHAGCACSAVMTWTFPDEQPQA